ncbi:MAG: flagellar export chaperone FliS [Pseudomonadales bacterium]|nr:flagellar export chaperone FliS [Pseudomonadales bacterium]
MTTVGKNVTTSANTSIDAYRQLELQTKVDGATPHELIDMLFNGARDKLNQAEGYIERGDIEARTAAVNTVVEILVGLQASLDHDKGPDVAGNLDSLYDYMQRRMFQANADNDLVALREVRDLLDTVQSAWVAIGVQVSAG